MPVGLLTGVDALRSLLARQSPVNSGVCSTPSCRQKIKTEGLDTRFHFHIGSGATRSEKSSCSRAVFDCCDRIADNLQATISGARQVERLSTAELIIRSRQPPIRIEDYFHYFGPQIVNGIYLRILHEAKSITRRHEVDIARLAFEVLRYCLCFGDARRLSRRSDFHQKTDGVHGRAQPPHDAIIRRNLAEPWGILRCATPK